MGIRVQRWGDRHPIWFFAIGLSAAASIFCGFMLGWAAWEDASLGATASPKAMVVSNGKVVHQGDVIATLTKGANGCVNTGQAGVTLSGDGNVDVTLHTDPKTCQVTLSKVTTSTAKALTAVQPAVQPLAGARCYHQSVADWWVQDINGRVYIRNKETANWYTDGVSTLNACSGADVQVTSGSYYCSWLSAYGYHATCTSWRSYNHAEVDGTDCVYTCWHEVVALDMTKYGGVTATCHIASGAYSQFPGADYQRCILVKNY